MRSRIRPDPRDASLILDISVLVRTKITAQHLSSQGGNFVPGYWNYAYSMCKDHSRERISHYGGMVMVTKEYLR